jgi:hypothetical protein
MPGPYHAAIAALLALSVSLLISMVPGGLIENRSFAHLRRPVFWGFNLFLVLLGCGSFATIALLLTGAPAAPALSLMCGVLIMLVFLLDLLGIFPRSPDHMGEALKTLEALALATGATIAVLSIHLLRG